MNFWRYQWLLFVAVLVILVAPYLLMRGVNARIHHADQMVAHTSQVDSTLSQLLHEVRDLESAASTLTANVDVPNVRRRIAESSAGVPVLLEELIRLTSDNPRQQLRVGALKARIEQRVQLSLRIIASKNKEERRHLLSTMINEFPMRGASAEVRKEEFWLLEERTAEARRLRSQGEWISLGSTLVQLALLSLMLWMLRRHQMRREHAERDTANANARALAVMQTIREPIALIDREQRVVMHNLAFDELYGDGNGEAQAIDGEHIGRIGGDAWSGREMTQRLRDVVSRGRELWDFELSQTTTDGIQRTMLLNARRMSLPDSEDEVALLILSDLTHQKAAEQEINELNRQLEGKIEQVSDVNRELEAFSYSVSHDLRAPLRHISGFTEKLGRQLGERADEKSRHYLATIGASARRMAALIDDLLVYSRLGRSALRLQPVDMQSMVQEARSLLDSNTETDTPGRRIEWRIDTLPVIVADENMMRQVWSNLLGNAVKYSAPRELTRIEVSHQRLPDGRHEFSVKDNGVGFDMAYAGKLFGVFQRMHKASEFPGTGIGLATVQRVLTRHGGQISAESAPNEGSTFRFVLPAMLDNPATGRD
ncbi:histidine kinase [Lysobacter pythonis]|uniref:histidine kinase n=1 Tax=Solilutibacter pythonis TaxID=2483112 RepID=A0A3M2HM58_9GAMM|nr:ATP-binding protein [Lysobacter pythonis]RMH90796.1 histidine kinase [Lysobacter pythonis]